MDLTNVDVGFYNLIIGAYENKLPFVVYRKSEDTEVKLVVQRNNALNYSKDYQESGFVFAPFDNREPSILFPLAGSKRYSCSFLNNQDIDIRSKKNKPSSSNVSKAKHIALVEKGIDFLKNNAYKKVVLSRKESIEHKRFDLVETYKKLLRNYKNAFVYCWFHPKVGLWMGATPETLLKSDNDTFSTMALASTQVYDAKKHELAKASINNEIIWGDKEIEEQQYVTDFILEQLKTSVDISRPYTTKAGNLLHIRTDISGKLTEQLNLKKIIDLLHPTPAVCGVPKQKAKEFIIRNEHYNRQFYTGFLGELNCDNTSDLYVNLRCMQVLKNNIEIYIGGGITEDSNPESEWEETVNKSKVMMKVL